MPLVRIDLLKGKPESYRAALSEVVHRALTESISVPAEDRFQVIAEHDPANFIFARHYLGIERTNDCIFIQLTISAGRSVELRQTLYKAIADGLHKKLGLRREDVFINIVEVAKENWSFGNGVAQYA